MGPIDSQEAREADCSNAQKVPALFSTLRTNCSFNFSVKTQGRIDFQACPELVRQTNPSCYAEFCKLNFEHTREIPESSIFDAFGFEVILSGSQSCQVGLQD